MRLEHINDEALLGDLTRLAVKEREATLDVLQYLAEVERRKLHLAKGYGSLFVFCREELKYSEGAAFRRVAAARLLARHPDLAPHLESGALSLSTLSLVRDVLTEASKDSLLPRILSASKSEVQRIVFAMTQETKASVSPAPGSAAAPMQLCLCGPALSIADALAQSAGALARAASAPTGVAGATVVTNGHTSCRQAEHGTGPALESPTPRVEPRLDLCPPGPVAGGYGNPAMVPMLTIANERRISLVVDRDLESMLDEARAFLSHKIPRGDLGGVLKEVLSFYLERKSPLRAGRRKRTRGIEARRASVELPPCEFATSPEKCGEGRAPEGGGGKSLQSGDGQVEMAPCTYGEKQDAPVVEKLAQVCRNSRRLSASLRRAVWERDGGECSFVSAESKRCGSKWGLEVHHRVPWSFGGPTMLENVTLRCKRHHALETERIFPPWRSTKANL